MTKHLNANDVLQTYKDEELPEFLDMELRDVNQRGNSGDRPLHVAAIRGRIAEVLALIEGGAEINSLGEMNYTAIQYAIIEGHSAIVKLLIERGAALEHVNELGETARSLSEKSKDRSIVELFKR